MPDARTVTTYYHATDRTPVAEPTLTVDSTGAILNTRVLGEAAPTYAPPGTGLISTQASRIAPWWASPRRCPRAATRVR